MEQSNKNYKSRAVGVMSEVGLTTDRDLSVLTVLKKHDVFYSSEILEVTWYEPLYNISPHQKKIFYYVCRTYYFCLLGSISIVLAGVSIRLLVRFCCIGEGLGTSNMS